MDGDLGAKLQEVLSDPAQMEKLKAAAESIFGGPQPSGGTEAPTEKAPPVPERDARFLAAIGKAFAAGDAGENRSRSTALLMAMRPYMRPEKQEKLDRALQIARMANIAGAVMKEYGGGGHGV